MATYPEKSTDILDADILELELASECDTDSTIEPDLDFDVFEQVSTSSVQSECSRSIEKFEVAQQEHPEKCEISYLWSTVEKGCNIVELCEDALYSVSHVLPSEQKPNTDDLISYLRQVFRTDDPTHETILKTVNEKPAAVLLLKVTVVEAKGLQGKDANGLSDPLCTLFINADQKYSTGVKLETLTPVWEEDFSL